MKQQYYDLHLEFRRGPSGIEHEYGDRIQRARGCARAERGEHEANDGQSDADASESLVCWCALGASLRGGTRTRAELGRATAPCRGTPGSVYAARRRLDCLHARRSAPGGGGGAQLRWSPLAKQLPEVLVRRLHIP
jgi:hypothetical protein